MSANLIIVTGLIYLFVCAEQALKGNVGLACMYAGYAFANYGSWILIMKS
jgi:hypothetical protein